MGAGQDAAAAGGGEAAAALAGGGDDPLRYAPRPDALVAKGGGAAAAAGGGWEDGAGGGSGVYRPPRLNPVSMELDERGDELSARERRQLLQAQRRAQRSGLVQELAAEVAGAPEEQRMTAAGMDTTAALRERQRLAAREDVEEELFVSRGGSPVVVLVGLFSLGASVCLCAPCRQAKQELFMSGPLLWVALCLLAMLCLGVLRVGACQRECGLPCSMPR